MADESRALKKLRKLFRDPTTFLLDSQHAHLGDAWLRARGEDGSKGDGRQVAYAWGFSEWKRDAIQRAFPEFQFRFLKGKQPLMHALRVLSDGDGVLIVWGYTAPNAVVALAKARRIPMYRMEDGFIRSVGLGASHALARSLVLDTSGRLYFDATGPTQLEQYCNEHDFQAEPGLLEQAEEGIRLLQASRISKYNTFAVNTEPVDPFGDLFPRAPERKRILVIGQVEDDASIRMGLASVESNLQAVQIARDENPDADIVFRGHPDYLAGHTRKRDLRADMRKIEEIAAVPTTSTALHEVLDWVDHVYTITSLAGFEALLRGKPVTCLGAPFYSGWGLTDDRVKVARRKRTLTLTEVFAAAYLLYPRYFDPYTGKNTTLKATVEELIAERDNFRSVPRATAGMFGFKTPALVFGVARQWRGAIAEMLPDYELIYAPQQNADETLSRETASTMRRLRLERPTTVVLIWGEQEPRGTAELAYRLGMQVLRMADGPIRGVGIGGDFDIHGRRSLPLSYCLDSKGLYYDAHRASHIENLLNDYPFAHEPELIERAKRCIERIKNERVTRHNTTERTTLEELIGPKTKRRILVIGQVETAPSVELACDYKITNNDVVVSAVQENPEAEVVYLPHRLSLRNTRERLSNPADVSGICTIVDQQIGLPDALAGVDKVYTISSLGGFEALLRGLPVTCFGSNFYSGWGLTDDRMPVPRRRRNLTVEEVFAAFYLLYCRYYDPSTHREVQLEDILDLLARSRDAQAGLDEARLGLDNISQPKVAIPQLEKAIAANPTVAKWRIALARCFVAEKRLDEARVLYDELLKRFASEPAWKYERLMLMITMNDPISACWEEFNQLRGLDTAPARLPIDMLAYARAHALDWSPLVPAAMQVAGKDKEPTDVCIVADALRELGEIETARQLLTKVVKDHPGVVQRFLRLSAELEGKGAAAGRSHTMLQSLRQGASKLREKFGQFRPGWFLVLVSEARELSPSELARAIVIGSGPVPGRALGQVLDCPGVTMAQHVFISEQHTTKESRGWSELWNSVEAGSNLVGMPGVGFASLAQSLDRRPSDMLVFAAFLVNAGVTLSDEAVSRLALAKPVQPTDSAAVKAEKRLLARFITKLSPEVSEAHRDLHPDGQSEAKGSAVVKQVKPMPKPAPLKNPLKSPVKKVR